jgi:hypothetical protein
MDRGKGIPKESDEDVRPIYDELNLLDTSVLIMMFLGQILKDDNDFKLGQKNFMQ